jgi:hypothetical protein
LNYYVYYKIDPASAAALRRAVESLFGKIEKQFGVRGRWMRRRDDQAFEALLAREAPALGPDRRVERFACA